ncbi:ABC transporter substrate-binding protein [Chloroflexota bacterium]
MKSKYYRLCAICLVSAIARLCAICLVSAIALLFPTACSSPLEGDSPALATNIDQLGRTVALDKSPQRIISLSPSNTEILYALGLADRVVAVTDYCNYPLEAEEKPTIGGFSTPNIEEIVALSPDLVLAAARHQDKIIPQLEGKGLTIFALAPKTIDSVLEAILLTGRITGVEEDAAELVDGMRQRTKAVTDRTAGLTPEQRLRTFYILWHDPLKTAGSGTLQDELIYKAGGTNSAQGLTDYVNISLEVVIVDNPEVIIAGVGHGSLVRRMRNVVRSGIGTLPILVASNIIPTRTTDNPSRLYSRTRLPEKKAPSGLIDIGTEAISENPHLTYLNSSGCMN